MLRIAIFASGRGSNFISLYNYINKNKINAEISVLITNNENSGALKFAIENNIPGFCVNEKLFNNKIVETTLKILNDYKINFIVLAGYMKLLNLEIIKSFENRIINIHPALLPKFGGKGMYGEKVHQAVLESKEKISGATVHLVNEKYDDGLIIMQNEVEVYENDNVKTLSERVLQTEHKLLPNVVELFSKEKIKIINNKIKILND